MIDRRFVSILLLILIRIFGVLIALFAIAYFLALVSFNGEDVSFNLASNRVGEVGNWLGSFGAHISELSYMVIGLSSFFLAIALFVLGSKMSTKSNSRKVLVKIILLPFGVLAMSLLLSTFPQPGWWNFHSLGGANGYFLLSKLAYFSRLEIALLTLPILLVLTSFIMDITLSDWVYFLRYFNHTCRLCILWSLVKLKKILLLILPKRAAKSDHNLVAKANLPLKKKENDLEIREVKKINTTSNSQPKQSSLLPKLSNSSSYQLPSKDLLVDRSAENKDKIISKSVVMKQSESLLQVLGDFGIKGEMIGVSLGPVVTLYEFEPAPGTKASRVIGLSDDIARSMSAVSARIAVIPGKTSIGVELPNPKRQMIFFLELIESKEYNLSSASLPMILGKDIGGNSIVADLAKMPHLLIAGTTGSGKSVGLNVMILSLLFKLRPDECKFIMIDPKMLELSIYDGIPHLLSPVVTEPGKAVVALKWVVAEMEERYRLMSSFAVRNIAGYNEKVEKAIAKGQKLSRKTQTGYDPVSGKPIIEETEFEPKKLPFIVVIVDEMADLMLVAGKEIENSIQRLAQMARAAGIHIIMATQRPSVDVITGVIKANFPTRISFQVTSRIDSRTILGVQGAEQLLGQGDMIYMSGGSKMIRAHGPFCSDKEIEDIVKMIKSQDVSEFGESEQIAFEENMSEIAELGLSVSAEGGNSDDDLYSRAVAIVKRDKKASISYVQRQLRIGYNRAAILIERMEEEGVVTPPNISGKRELIE